MAIVRGFCDGRGKPKDRFVTLSVLVADADIWNDVQREWIKRVNGPLQGFPMGVADCLSGGKKLKNVPEADRLFALSEAITILNYWTRHGLTAYACVVVMDDHRALKPTIPTLNDPEALCVDYIIPCVDYQFREPNRFEYFFDEGERFLRYVEPYWKRTASKRALGPYYLRRVDILTTAPSTRAAIQCADVYTWTIHTHCLGRQFSTLPESIQEIIKDPPIHAILGYDKLTKPQARNRVLASMTRVPEWIPGFIP